MNNKIYFILAVTCFLFSTSCEKKNRDYHLPIMEDRVYTIEKIICDEKNRYFSWQCSFSQNYIQKDIKTNSEKTFTFNFKSDNFNRDYYGFRVNIYINNIFRFRRSTRDFPFETSLVIPEGATVNVKTFFEQYANINTNLEDSGTVNCKVSCE